MDTPSSVLNHPFDLVPIYILGWVTPVRPEDTAYAGIPIALCHARPEGLQCMIYSWTTLKSGPWTMAVLDRVEVYVNDVRIPEAGFTVQQGQENQEYFLFDLPQGRLREGVNTLHYTVQRPSENTAPSLSVNVLYHMRAPGDPGSSMVLTIPPEVIETGVGFEEAARGVKFGFTYPYRRNYDRISFSIGLANELFDAPDVPTPVERTLHTETFQQAGNNPDTPLQFRVTDQLGNSNLSSISYLDVSLDRVSMDFGPDYSQAATKYFIVRGRPPLMPPPDATATYTRTPTGGVLPYGYSSSNEQVAIVDASSGLMRATGNGVARIIATDAKGNTASYQITISGVRWVERVDGMWWSWEHERPRPDLHLTLEEMKRFWALYYPSEGPVATALGWPSGWYWTSTNVETDDNAWAVELDSPTPTEAQQAGGERFPGIKKL